MSQFAEKWIPEVFLDAVAERVSELNARAAKLGLAPLVLSILDYEMRELTHPLNPRVKYPARFVWVAILGESPVVAGWSLAAVVSLSDGGERLVKAVPGAPEIPESYRLGGFYCDHCHSDRLRKEVFVLSHEDGRYQQVGRQCLRDFLGHESPEAILAAAEFFSKLEGSEGSDFWDMGYGRVEPATAPEAFLAMASIVIRKLGWKPASSVGFGEPSTAKIVWGLFHYHPNNAKDVQKFIEEKDLNPIPEDESLAVKALEWGRGLPVQGVPNYLYNLGVASRSPAVTAETLGLMGSLIPAYRREVEKQATEYAKREEQKPAKHVGVVGKRQDFRGVTLTLTREFASDWGLRTLVKLVTPDGEPLVWWASGSLPDWMFQKYEAGESFDIAATVKSHEDYKGQPQTIIQRVSEAKPPKAPKRSKKAVAPETANELEDAPF